MKLADAVRRRLAAGHNDTCSRLLGNYTCSCGHAELEDALLAEAEPEAEPQAALRRACANLMGLDQAEFDRRLAASMAHPFAKGLVESGAIQPEPELRSGVERMDRGKPRWWLILIIVVVGLALLGLIGWLVYGAVTANSGKAPVAPSALAAPAQTAPAAAPAPAAVRRPCKRCGRMISEDETDCGEPEVDIHGMPPAGML
jgi:hypothetical protein